MLHLEHSFATDLDEEFGIPWRGADIPEPRVVLFNADLADALGLPSAELQSPAGARVLAGVEIGDDARPVAQAYAGHQFGGFSPRLGDGRALLLGEILDAEGRRHDLHLKGSGATPFSRGGDGKAVLGPVLREYLIGEAMHALGIPTTRALAALTTGEMVLRQGGGKPGAILARVASSHLRIGSFEYFTAQRDHERVRQLVDYALRRHDPDRVDARDPALELLRAVRDRQASLVAQWMGVGFIHGVMNTDNTTISGETIDYGPCAFMDAYDPKAVFSSIDRNGRYAYAQQPAILQWNLARLAEALLPIIEADSREAAVEVATAEIDAFAPLFIQRWTEVMRRKVGLRETREDDPEFISEFFDLLSAQAVDFTGAFRDLSGVLRGDPEPLLRRFSEDAPMRAWLARWSARLESEGGDPGAIAGEMERVNPIYIPRNHLVEEALAAAETELDFGPTERLLEVLLDPFTEREGLQRFAERAPEEFGPYVTFCGT